MASIKTMTGKPRKNERTGRTLAGLKSYKVRWYYPTGDGKAEEQTVTWRNYEDARSLRNIIEQRGGRVRSTDPDVMDFSIVTGRKTRTVEDLPPAGPTVADVVVEFIAKKAKDGKKANTIATYQSANRAGVLRAVWPDLPVAALDEDKAVEFVAHLVAVGMDHRAPLQFLRSVILFAIAKGYLTTNPLSLVAKPPTPKPLPRYVSIEEFGAIYGKVEADDDEYRLMLWTAWETGMREGEICALERGDITIVNGEATINVCKTVALGNKVPGRPRPLIITLPKSGKPRTIPCPLDLAKRLLVPGRHPSRIFPAKQNPNRLLRPQYLGKRFAVLRTQITLTNPRLPKFHDLRHSYASNQLGGGVSLEVVSQRLGHSSITVTYQYYISLLKSATTATLQAIAAHRPPGLAAVPAAA